MARLLLLAACVFAAAAQAPIGPDSCYLGFGDNSPFTTSSVGYPVTGADDCFRLCYRCDLDLLSGSDPSDYLCTSEEQEGKTFLPVYAFGSVEDVENFKVVSDLGASLGPPARDAPLSKVQAT